MNLEELSLMWQHCEPLQIARGIWKPSTQKHSHFPPEKLVQLTSLQSTPVAESSG